MNIKYEKKEALTFIGFHTEIRPDEAFRKCPEFWEKEYEVKYARLWRTMKPETAVEAAILENGIGLYAICASASDRSAYWIAGLFKGGAVPQGLELTSFPAGVWAVFSAKGALPDSLRTLNTAVWQEWFPNEGRKRGAVETAVVEVCSGGNPQSMEYACGIWVPVRELSRNEKKLPQ